MRAPMQHSNPEKMIKLFAIAVSACFTHIQAIAWMERFKSSHSDQFFKNKLYG
jgi:hypothetical protein